MAPQAVFQCRKTWCDEPGDKYTWRWTRVRNAYTNALISPPPPPPPPHPFSPCIRAPSSPALVPGWRGLPQPPPCVRALSLTLTLAPPPPYVRTPSLTCPGATSPVVLRLPSAPPSLPHPSPTCIRNTVPHLPWRQGGGVCHNLQVESEHVGPRSSKVLGRCTGGGRGRAGQGMGGGGQGRGTCVQAGHKRKVELLVWRTPHAWWTLLHC